MTSILTQDCCRTMVFARVSLARSSRGEVVEEKQEANRRFEEVIAAASAQAKAERVKLQSHIVAGHAVPSIVEFNVQHGFDLLVIGYMGHSMLYNRLIGSSTDRLVEIAPSPVLVVK